MDYEERLAGIVRAVVPHACPSMIDEILALTTRAAGVQKKVRIRLIEEFIATHDLPRDGIDWLELLIGLAHLCRGLSSAPDQDPR